ncbi:MAG: helix-turn-helix domain-containing protein [Propionibacteriales bacterium]|nr:helix-turn-helix domain-containing protein [Propionibacteriales bacterium]
MTAPSAVRSVTRAVDVLMALTSGPRSLGRLAEETKLSKTTVHRLLASLSHHQLIMQDTVTADYLLGPGSLRLVDALTTGMGGIGILARPVLSRLQAETLETVTLHTRFGAQRICVEELPSQLAIRYTAGVGAASPVHTGSAGKVLLAYMDAGEREHLLDHADLEALTDATITDRATLERELALVRRRGFAESHGERVVGGAAVSAPVWAPTGHILAALSVLGPEGRLKPAKLREIRPSVVEGAREISRRIAGAQMEQHDKDREKPA